MKDVKKLLLEPHGERRSLDSLCAKVTMHVMRATLSYIGDALKP